VKWPSAQERAEQTHEMYQAYLRGLSLTEVGALYGLGAERVRQLFYLEHLPTRQHWRPPNPPKPKQAVARRS
jgi:hypothetical protein